MSGNLDCRQCGQTYRVVRGIPRFVSDSSYARSFGFQWNRFRLDQLDSANGTRLSAGRFYSETGWSDDWLKEKLVLDAGCGAGRFLEVASRTSAQVVGVDLSEAVDAARMTLAARPNVHLVQAPIGALPFRPGSFDAVYCIGVLQHTSDPASNARALGTMLKRDGRIALTVYERKPWTRFYAKYWARRLTRSLSDRALLRLIQWVMPLGFLLTEVLYRVPLLARVFRFLIPVANYVGTPGLSLRQRYAWAVLDTFDMLAPKYDQPQTLVELERPLRAAGVEAITRLPNAGLNVIGRKAQ